jgi:hypothetical protein
MKRLQHVVGFILVSVGVLFAIGFVDLLFKPNLKSPWWAYGIGFIILGVIPFLGGFFLLRSHLASRAPCPNCGGVDRERTTSLRARRRWSTFYLGGWIIPALWRASKKSEFRCAGCQTFYLSETGSSRITKFFLWGFIFLVVLGWMLELSNAQRP